MRRPVSKTALKKAFRRHDRNLEMSVPPWKRKSIEEAFLKNKTPEEIREISELRKKVFLEKARIRRAVSSALDETVKQFPFVKGVVLFGSFSRGVVNPKDIDTFQVINRNLLEEYIKAHPGCINRGDELDQMLKRAAITPQVIAWHFFSDALHKRTGFEVRIVLPDHVGDFNQYILYDPKEPAVMVHSILNLMAEYRGLKHSAKKPAKAGFKPMIHHFLGDAATRRDFATALKKIDYVSIASGSVRNFDAANVILRLKRLPRREMTFRATRNEMQTIEANFRKTIRMRDAQTKENWFKLLYTDELFTYRKRLERVVAKKPLTSDLFLLGEARALDKIIRETGSVAKKIDSMLKLAYVLPVWKELMHKQGF